MLNVKLNAVRRKDKANPLGFFYWNRELLYYLHLFQFVFTVVLTDYFMLMVVLMCACVSFGLQKGAFIQ